MGKERSRYQKKVIRDWYRNRDAIRTQRLGEIVTEIYLAGTERKRANLWQRAEKILGELEGLHPDEAARIVKERDVEALAAIAGEAFQG